MGGTGPVSGSCNTVLLFGVLEVVVHGAFIKGPHSKSSSLQSPKTRRTRREVFLPRTSEGRVLQNS